MIKILDDTKILSQLVNDNTNGIGQFQPLSAIVTEELNGIYEAEITMLDTDKHYNDLKVDGILEIQTKEESNNSNQLFRIYYISKPINQVITIKAAHITYDLNKVPVKPFNSTGAVNTKNAMIRNIIGSYPFTMTTDISNNTSYFSLDVPRSFRECLGGYEGSILDTFKCEYEWDNLNVGMLAHRGTDNGVRIAYGKNLTDINQEENIENVYTAVLGYAKKTIDDVERTIVGEVYTKVQATYPRVLIVDFSQDYFDSEPSVESLTQKAQDYATNNDIEVPNVNITVSFVPLYQTEEYKNIAPLERVSLGDTVHIFFEKLGIETSARVVKTVWNVNLKKYDSVELGAIKSSLSSVIDSSMNQIKNEIIDSIDVSFDAGAIERQVTDLGNLITNGLGLHMTTVEVAGGGYRLYLHNKETLAESDTQYTMGADGFVVSTDYGQTWNAGFDAEGNAVVNSLSTIVLKALEIYGSYMVFGDYPNGKYIEASTYSNSSSVPQGVSFDGTGTIRMQPQEAFIINNLNANGDKAYNRLRLNKTGTNSNNFIDLINYDDTQNYITANFIELDAHYTTTPYNRLVIHNYMTSSGTSYSANMILLRAGQGTTIKTNSITIGNNSPNTTLTKNNIEMSTSTNATTVLSLNNYGQYANNTNHLSNKIALLYSQGSRNMIDIYNYHPTRFNGTTTLTSNRITLDSKYEYNTLSIDNYNVKAKVVNNFTMYSFLNAENSYITLTNGRYEDGTSYYDRNRITLQSHSTLGTYIMLVNNNSSGGTVNSIELNATNEQLTIFSKSDIRINSTGAVRLTSGNTQDITMTSADDINISAADKFYISIAGIQHQLSFGSDGNVKWS